MVVEMLGDAVLRAQSSQCLDALREKRLGPQRAAASYFVVINSQHFRYTSHLAQQGKTKPSIGITGAMDASREPANVLHTLFAHHDGRRRDPAAEILYREGKVILKHARLRERANKPRRLVSETGNVGEYCNHGRVCRSKPDSTFEEPGHPLVVGVEESNPFCVGFRNAAVPGSALAGVGLSHQPNTRIGVLPHDIATAIGRAVVHNNKLEIAVSLSKHRVHRPSNVICPVYRGMTTETPARITERG